MLNYKDTQGLSLYSAIYYNITVVQWSFMCFSLPVRVCSFITVNGFPQPPRTGTTGAGRTSCCAQTAAFTSRSTVSCPPSRSLWTRRHLCSNLSKRKRMDSAGSIAWGPDGTEARYAHTLALHLSLHSHLQAQQPQSYPCRNVGQTTKQEANLL